MDRSIRGRRVEYLSGTDRQAPLPRGVQGTAQFVDDAGRLHVDWDNGLCWGLTPGKDCFRLIPDTEYAQ